MQFGESSFPVFDDGQSDERRFENHLSGNPAMALPECWYWIRNLQARFFAGDYAAAVDASLRARPLLWTAPSCFEKAEYHFYSALSRAAFWDQGEVRQDGLPCSFAKAADHKSLSSVAFAKADSGPVGRQQHFKALIAHYEQLAVWAEDCPENFENRAALVGAEIARIEGRELDAERLYEQAIRSAHSNGFVHNEALANEIASRFYGIRGFEKIARMYLRDARYGYLRWGAVGKVKQLDELFPYLEEDQHLQIEISERRRAEEALKKSERLAGEIHDSLAQSFTGITMQLEMAKEVMPGKDDDAIAYVERANDLARFGLAEARRSILSLQPMNVEDASLIECLRRLVERSNIPGRLRCIFRSNLKEDETLPLVVRQDLLRIAQEAISNALRHAKSTAICVSLRLDPPNLIFKVKDDGRSIPTKAETREGFGLVNMRTRVNKLRGTLDIRTVPGRGTTIVVCVPVGVGG